ncbi:hypothetical protein KQX54_011524 [Cotesia glomerata]|uniref:Uncharacterized protein n=1 Tax=Cotesia glomerata TaxID=32391 RepID=A0AAV7J6D9_COTGL|nr:hypothetical protein KQX54_011524 [Cotesia glomerata]
MMGPPIQQPRESLRGGCNTVDSLFYDGSGCVLVERKRGEVIRMEHMVAPNSQHCSAIFQHLQLFREPLPMLPG